MAAWSARFNLGDDFGGESADFIAVENALPGPCPVGARVFAVPLAAGSVADAREGDRVIAVVPADS